ncbi:MAG: methyltransferase domain-containing protein [Promethearchaeota archaeon]
MINKDFFIAVEEEAILRYSNRYKNLGFSPKSLGWGCKEDQLERFQVIFNHVDLEGKTVMDIGCGFADLYLFLTEKGVKLNYIGVDIVPDFINYCKDKFPNQKFFNKNIMYQTNELPKADIVISLGTLNFKLENNLNFEYSKFFIKEAFELTKELLIVDFLSEYRTPDYPKEDFVFYHQPEEVIKFAMKLTNNISIIHNYRPIPQKEFMILMEKKKVMII